MRAVFYHAGPAGGWSVVGFRVLVGAVVSAFVLVSLIPIASPAAAPNLGNLRAVPNALSWYVKYDENTRFLWGNFTWQDGAGRIVWGPVPESTGGGGTPDANREAQWQNGNDYETYSGEPLAPYPDPDVFTSDPLPETLYVNVTKSILVDLQMKEDSPSSAECSYSWYMGYNPTLDFEMDLELYAGEKLLGGSAGRNYIYWPFANPSTKVRPTDPAGHSTCHFAATPEAGILAKGTTVKVKLLHVSQDHYFTYGFGGDHPSTIRIPLYGAEETLFRYPNLTPDEASDEGGESPSGDGPSRVTGVVDVAPRAPNHDGIAAGSFGLVAIAGLALAAGRPRTRALFIALAFAGMALSGCVTKAGSKDAAGDDSKLGGQVTQTFVKDVTGELVTSGGSIVGEVHDDLHIPVSGVHVSILGFPDFTSTDGKGRFKFLNLAPAVYTIRFDKAEYKSFEAQVEVKAGFVSKPAIMLYLVNMKDRDFRPHLHDYWPAGVGSKLAMNAPVPVTCAGNPPTCPVYGIFRTAPKDGDSNAIIPGTYNTEVTFTFTEANMQSPELSVALYHSTSWINASFYPARPAGVPYNVATSWEMSDPGHAPYSYWYFYWGIPARHIQGSIDGTTKPITEPPHPDLAAKIMLTKGPALPLEPKHPDDWGDKTEMLHMKDVPIGYPYSSLYPPGSPYGWSAYTGKGCMYWGKKIPAGTKTVEITLKMTRDVPYDWVVKYKPANVAPHTANFATWQGFKVAPMTSTDGLKAVYKIDVKPEETDFMYAKPTSTGWQVCYEPSNYDAWWKDGMMIYGTNVYTGAGTSTGMYPYPSMTGTMKITRGTT